MYKKKEVGGAVGDAREYAQLRKVVPSSQVEVTSDLGRALAVFSKV